MKKIKSPLIKQLIEEYDKPVEYKGKKEQYYEKPKRGGSLIPPRILLTIIRSGNSLEWKAEALNERERHYERVVKTDKNRKYPIWKVCKCGKELVIQRQTNYTTRCLLTFSEKCAN